MDKAGIVGLTMPLGVTGTIMRRERGNNMMCLVPDKVPSVHFGGQLIGPLHVLGEQFGHLLRW